MNERSRSEGAPPDASLQDPLLSLFGASARALFASPELVVTHGPLERLPDFMHQGPLASADALCRHYTGPLEVSNGSAAGGVQTPVRGAHPSALLRMGLTVYFRDLRRALPSSSSWLEALEAALGLPECASLAAFANAAGSGLPLHHDMYDQLLFQIRGEKLFRHRPNGYVKHPDTPFTPFTPSTPEWGQTYRRGFPLTTNEVIEQGLEDLTLKPGSALFMPAGTWHTTADQTDDALSVIVVVRAPSRLSLLGNLLRYYAGQSEEFRAPAYGGWSTDAHLREREHANLARLLEDLAGRLRTLPAADAYEAWSLTEFLSGSRAYPHGAKFSRYVRIPRASVRFEAAPEPERVICVVSSGPATQPATETKLLIAAHARGIVEWISTTHEEFSTEVLGVRFSDYDPTELNQFLSTLAGASLIRPIPTIDWTA